MNTTNLLEQLLQNGECLTYRQEYSGAMISAVKEAEKKFKKENPQKACLIGYDLREDCGGKKNVPHKYLDFHYFSDGTLVICLPPEKSAKIVEKARKYLTEYGYEIKQICGPAKVEEWEYYFKLLLDITEKTRKKYDLGTESLQIRVFDTPQEFADFCFADNPILLTADKNSSISPQYRRFLALFSNGKFAVSEDYHEDEVFAYSIEIEIFKREVKDEFPSISPIFVPQNYLEELYKRAEKYDWFISAEKAAENMPTITEEDKQKMRQYAENLLHNRKCISVTTPRIRYMSIYLDPLETSPDYNRYVLFDDGKLVMSKKYHKFREGYTDPLISSLKRCFPQMSFQTEPVPDYYITFLYEEIAKKQKSAQQIYADIMQKKANLIAHTFEIPLVSAQDVCAIFNGHKNFDEIFTCSEIKARRMICMEQNLELRAQNMGYDNSVLYNGLKYLDLLEKQNSPYENKADFVKILRQNFERAKRK